jgi:HTH-type transcriptional regulator, competence development regulator
MKQGKERRRSMSELGTLLRQLRELGGKSLRDVEEDTGKEISNAYLSQLERGVAENPSPHLLHKLADYYEVPYETLMVAAGYVESQAPGQPSVRPSSLEVLLKSAKLTPPEEEEVKKFVRFLRSDKK